MRRLLVGIVSVAASLLGSQPTDAVVHDPEQPAIERIGKIRAALLAEDADRNMAPGDEGVAQWYNWPNWGNWNNWPNWYNYWINY